MSIVAFDTLKFAQTLRDKAKFSHEQAEGISQAFADATSEELAIKSDLKSEILAVRTDVKNEIAAVRSDIRELELRMTIKLGGLIVAAVGVILAAFRYLPAPHP